MGYSMMDMKNMDFELLCETADTEMYRNKEKRRNRNVFRESK